MASGESRQAESGFLTAVKVWAALAWADDVIHPNEAEAINRLVTAAGLSAHDQDTVRGWLSSRVELEVEYLGGLSDAGRVGIYRAAVRLARVDNHFSDEERAFLERLREGLGIAPEKARAIEEQAGE